MKQTRHPSPTRMIYQTDETRERIIETALGLFTERGFSDAQMQDIARAAGISRTSLYRYFQDKIDLSLIMMNRMLERLALDGQASEEEPETTGLQRLERHLRRVWLSPLHHREYLFLAEFDAAYSGRVITPQFRRKIRAALRVHKTARLPDLLREGMRDGSIRGDIDPHLAAVTILNSVRGLQQRLLLRGRALMEVTQDELHLMQDEHLRLLLDGLKPPLQKKGREE